jgi:hypothetical protein
MRKQFACGLLAFLLAAAGCSTQCEITCDDGFKMTKDGTCDSSRNLRTIVGLELEGIHGQCVGNED